MGVGIGSISKELMLACRQLGQVVSQTLAALVASTVVNPDTGGFWVERTLDEGEARAVVESAASQLVQNEEPSIACLRLQAAYEAAFADHEQTTERAKGDAKVAEDSTVSHIANFTATFNEDFDRLTALYKMIYRLLLLKCTGPEVASKVPTDPTVEREVAAALESVFPRVGLRSFVALTGPEKIAQLQELAGIVLGIRLFNQHQGKGGAGLPPAEQPSDRLEALALLELVQKEAEEVGDVCQAYADVIVAVGKYSKREGTWNTLPSEAELERARSDLLYNRQYLCYLLNLQEDLAGGIDRLGHDEKQLGEELTDLDALVGGRVSVPKEQVYPRFDALARGYQSAWREKQALRVRTKLHSVLSDLRKQYHPELPQSAKELLERVAQDRDKFLADEEDLDEHTDLETRSVDGTFGVVRLTVENCPDFLQLPLDFQGFCIHTLVTQSRLLVPGNPAIGVMKYLGRHCVFANERACLDFFAEPDKYFAGVREVCYQHPELIHLLRLHEDFPRSSLQGIVKVLASSPVVMQADAGTETPLHFEESKIDKNYEWNEWRLRTEALHMADIRKKTTSATQTALSHLKRESETQVYLPKEVATNTNVERGTNPPRWSKYYVGLRGEPQKMQVAEIKLDFDVPSESRK
eukprot:CAMPEP_0170607356 /NCGR_PEP_ID=MMETSP0224-20130122/21010_1 /TAXON_ID=285029 /ORGANISM="Togula jolla, Strain CCCM 725" /LENGTH=638 /DNA_ID=CAMNT_0010932515 /DNA_START=55 /DNA_END=1972 /DNA_ORIENTATION=-